MKALEHFAEPAGARDEVLWLVQVLVCDSTASNTGLRLETGSGGSAAHLRRRIEAATQGEAELGHLLIEQRGCSSHVAHNELEDVIISLGLCTRSELLAHKRAVDPDKSSERRWVNTLLDDLTEYISAHAEVRAPATRNFWSRRASTLHLPYMAGTCVHRGRRGTQARLAQQAACRCGHALGLLWHGRGVVCRDHGSPSISARFTQDGGHCSHRYMPTTGRIELIVKYGCRTPQPSTREAAALTRYMLHKEAKSSEVEEDATPKERLEAIASSEMRELIAELWNPEKRIGLIIFEYAAA
jgi:hypothetical protein